MRVYQVPGNVVIYRKYKKYCKDKGHSGKATEEIFLTIVSSHILQ